MLAACSQPSAISNRKQTTDTTMQTTQPTPEQNLAWLQNQIHHAIDQMNEACRHGDQNHAVFWQRRWKRLEQAYAALALA